MLYLKKDVLILTDNFKNYIDTCKKSYDENPLYSSSTPKFTWRAGLKMIGGKIDYITDDKLRILLENMVLDIVLDMERDMVLEL